MSIIDNSLESGLPHFQTTQHSQKENVDDQVKGKNTWPNDIVILKKKEVYLVHKSLSNL
jgi:hypothetical protein